MRYLVAVDGWDPSQRALEFAAREAEDSGAKLDVVHVVDLEGGDPESNEQIRETIEDIVADVELNYEVHFLRTKKRSKPAKRVGERILEFVEEHDVDEVFLGNEPTGTAERMIVGSVASVIMEDRSVPVTLVP